MRKTNILFILWGAIVIGIITGLTILGFLLEKMNNNYKKLEEKIKDSAIKYSESESLYPEGINEIKVTKDELVENDFLDELKIKEDICDGYVTIKLDEVYQYDAYIKCKKYTTKGYSK